MFLMYRASVKEFLPKFYINVLAEDFSSLRAMKPLS